MKPLIKQILLGAALTATSCGMAFAAGDSELGAMPMTYDTQTTTLPGDQMTHPGGSSIAQLREQGFHPLQAMRNTGDRLLHAPKTASSPKEFNDNTGE